MPTYIPDLRKFITTQEIKDGSAVSQSTWRKIAGMLNFIGHRNHQEKQFFANGVYSIMPSPQTFVDGLVFFEFDAEIINVWVFNIKPGVSGITEIDIKKKPKGSGTFTSIFSTTPKIAPSAGTNVFFELGDIAAGITAPVLASNQVNRGDALRLDLIQTMPQAENCGVVVHYRPR